MSMIRPLRVLLTLLPACAALANSAGTRDGDRLEQQREAFRVAYAEAELGDFTSARDNEALLRDYVLWPDLRAAWLRTRVRNGDDAGIDAFLDEYGALKPARELRYLYSVRLASDGRLQEYLAIYRQFYQGLGIAKLDCLALQAEIQAGGNSSVVPRALEKWLIGQSQVGECDPVFDYLRGLGALGESEYRQRYGLAIDARNFSLARYLARQLEPQEQDEAARWLNAQRRPERLVEDHANGAGHAAHTERLVYALERLAYRDPPLATRHWDELRGQYDFTATQERRITRHIALWSARKHGADARGLLRALDGAAVDAEVRRWRVRASLREHDWPEVVDHIVAMPPEQQERDEWRFWQAVALRRTGDEILGAELLEQLSGERSYYGFLAADELGADYAFRHATIVRDDAVIEELAGRPAIRRARELFMTGLEGRGRSEWDAATRMLTNHEKEQAALLAHEWGWHSRAIAMAAASRQFDDLQVRYPLPYRETFDTHAEDAQISNSWAYGIARSESLFMRDIRSSAGAIGVMQLMPETGRRTARWINYPYSGSHTLTDPQSNILLGTTYLGRMYRRFGENRVLATAAYNAGPLRVEAWLPQSSSLDARIWIENIPFDETRQYVQRVLAGEAIFHWRLTGDVQRLADSLTEITVPTGVSVPASTAGTDPD